MADEVEQLTLGEVPPAAAPRGPGRPVGALNRKTRVLGDYLAAMGCEPALILARAATRSIDETVKELGCTKLEAEEMRLDAAESLMPYVHGKMPTEQLQSDERLPMLVIEGVAKAVQAVEGSGGAAFFARPWTEQNQAVSGVEPDQSHDGKSHE